MTWLQQYLKSRYGATAAREMMDRYEVDDDSTLNVTGPEFQFESGQ